MTPTLAIGTEVYRLGNPPVVALGYQYDEEEFGQAMSGAVADALCDTEGCDLLRDSLLNLADTEFEVDSVDRILNQKPPLDDWRVGEAIAECYLAEHRRCVFPWPDSRDARNPNASHPGADLVGFQSSNGDDFRFAFGEVKTSFDKNCPPKVLHGKAGLAKQLEDLATKRAVRDALVKYMQFRAGLLPDCLAQFQTATRRYLKNSEDCVIFGVLIRDVVPHENDLKSRHNQFEVEHKHKSPTMEIEFIAIYLPLGKIQSLGSIIAHTRGGAA